MTLPSPSAKAMAMHTHFRRLYDRPCPAVGCPYHAARDGKWLICAGGHRMRARQR